MRSKDATTSNIAAWDITARKYEGETAADVQFLLSGGVSLLPIECELLGDLSTCGHAIHLQCSHGLDALSLLNLGVGSVVGVDVSPAMLALAHRKSASLGANAHWIQSDVLDLPSSLAGTADLVYTGKGALPWVFDLDQWASGASSILRPGGRLFVMEGHPLNWVWLRGHPSHVLDPSRGGYFDSTLRANEGFPGSAVERLSPDLDVSPVPIERQWNLGQLVTAISEAGLIVQRMEELSDHFWPEFPEVSPEEARLLPHSFALAAVKPS